MVAFRAASISRRRLGPRHPLSVVVGGLYRLVVEWVLTIEIPWQVEVGPRLRLFHGAGIVINPAAKLGADVVIRQGVTVGNRRTDFDCPVVHDGCELGAYCAVLGDISVGPGAKIGAHAVVIESVPQNAVAVGNPARVLPETP